MACTSDPVNICITTNTTFTLNGTLTNEDGTPIDLTGANVYFKMYRSQGDDEVVIDKSTVNGGIVVADPTTGVFILTILASETAVLSGGYWFDIMLEESGGGVKQIGRGEVVTVPGSAV